ncbi:hypothetical protein CFH99_17315 [Nocardioides aromaticivorans]|uniref:Uncharacterized protein n=2 Tax=Nocardioides aromaticivorans TaxID=200618 RepID=A0ABX7PNI3_9ACTN|nr:hypothetical protein CFH99_17315 [Nocardioides aromaticivorans]
MLPAARCFCHAVAMAETPSTSNLVNPLDLLIKSQQVALKLTTDVLRTVRDTAVDAVTQPDELAKQVGELAGAVAGMATAVTGIAGATAQPLQDFIVRQRELADTVHTLAEAQAELAGVVAKLAERHAEAVAALEKVTAPIFTIVGTDPTPPKTRASKKTAAARQAPRKAAAGD